MKREPPGASRIFEKRRAYGFATPPYAEGRAAIHASPSDGGRLAIQRVAPM